MKKIFYFIAAMLLLSGCVYPYEVDSVEVEKILVIDGDILIGQNSKFTTKFVSPLNVQFFEDAMGQLRVEGSDGAVYKSANSFDTSLFSIDMTGAPTGCEYRVVFECPELGKSYSSNWVPVATAPGVVTLGYQRRSSTVFIYANMKANTEVAYVRTTYDQVWEYTASYPITVEYDPETNMISELMTPDYSYYYCWDNDSPRESHIATNEGKTDYIIPNATITEIERTDQRFSSLYCVKAHVFGLTKEHYDYLDNLQKVSEVSGSLFSPTPSEPRGNIYCDQEPTEKVIGYVGASTRTDAELFIRKEAVYIRLNPERFLFFPEEDVPLLEYYEKGYLPVKEDIYGNGYQWGPARCVDCRRSGGTKEKPEGWPSINV